MKFKAPTFGDIVRTSFRKPDTSKHETAPTPTTDKPKAEEQAWIAFLPSGQCLKGNAKTKSEFRAVAKRLLGLSPEDRLPKGTIIERKKS